MRQRKYIPGFTLIELLVVVALIGLVLTYVVIHIERDLDQVAELEAQRFKALIEYARDESLLSGKPYAIEFDESKSGYRFLTTGTAWQEIDNDQVLRPRRLPEGIQAQLALLDAVKGQHLIVVDGLGTITPFTLSLRGDTREYRVTTDAAQNITIRSDYDVSQGKG